MVKEFFKKHNVLFCTNGDIVPCSPLIDSINTYYNVIDNNLLCIPGKNIANNMPIFGLQAFQLMINEAIKQQYDYIIYIDADCFVMSIKNLKLKFEEFVDGNYILGGVPDGGIFCHRNTNNYCINPFLAFFNISNIKKHIVNGQLMLMSPKSENDIPTINIESNRIILDQCKTWRNTYQQSVPYMQTSNFLKTNNVQLAYTTQFSLMTEWYYKLFLGFQYTNEKIMYIHGRDYVCDADPLGLTSGLYINEHMEDDSNLICLHTWFSRVLINPNMPDPGLNPRDDVDSGLNHRRRIMNVISMVKNRCQI